MNQHLIVLMIVFPMLAGIVMLVTHGRRKLQRTMGVGFLIANVAVAVWATLTVFDFGMAQAAFDADPGAAGSVLVSQMGNWPAPFGISIVVDPLAAVMVLVTSIVCLCVYVFCIFQLNDDVEGGLFHPLFHLLLFGVNWSFITGDLFNLFVAFEIMLMASYAMFVVGTTRRQMRQAYKYVLLNLIASTLFVTCCGLLYGQIGTLNMADITRIAMTGGLPTASIPVIALLLLVFGSKTAIFPLWYWLPDTYHTLPPAIGGLFAGLLTKVGAYVMIRVFVMMFGGSTAVMDVVTPIILVSAGITMFLGVLGAVSMHTVRRILSIHIISQVGYMILGIGLMTQLAIAGAIFFILHNMVVKCCLFLCAGLMHQHAGSDDLDKIGGLLKRAPWFAALFLIAALSLAGLPPLSGFFGKWVLIHEGFNEGQYVLVFFAVFTSLFTLLSMLKIWSYGFWSPPAGDHVDTPEVRPRTAGGLVAITVLVVMALSMGIGARWWLQISQTAANVVMTRTAYVEAVLGPNAFNDGIRLLGQAQSDEPIAQLAAAPAPGSIPAIAPFVMQEVSR